MPPSWKIEKRPYLRNSATDRHEILLSDALAFRAGPAIKISNSLKPKTADGRHLKTESLKTSNISATVDRSPENMAWWLRRSNEFYCFTPYITFTILRNKTEKI